MGVFLVLNQRDSLGESLGWEHGSLQLVLTRVAGAVVVVAGEGPALGKWAQRPGAWPGRWAQSWGPARGLQTPTPTAAAPDALPLVLEPCLCGNEGRRRPLGWGPVRQGGQILRVIPHIPLNMAPLIHYLAPGTKDLDTLMLSGPALCSNSIVPAHPRLLPALQPRFNGYPGPCPPPHSPSPGCF